MRFLFKGNGATAWSLRPLSIRNDFLLEVSSEQPFFQEERLSGEGGSIKNVS
jgi:hypothetical protein